MTVPSTEVVLIKSVHIFSQQPTESDIQAYVTRPITGVSSFFILEKIQYATMRFWEGWIVAEAGDVISVYASAANINFWVSGTKLPVSS